MKIETTNKVEENIITVEIKVASMGNTTLSAEQETALTHDFTRTIQYSDIDFKANVKVDPTTNNVIVTTDPTDGTAVEEIHIDNIINKIYKVDETLDIEFVIDTNKIPTSAFGTVMNSADKMGRAYAVIFATKVKEAIKAKLAEIYAMGSEFEGTTEEVL